MDGTGYNKQGVAGIASQPGWDCAPIDLRIAFSPLRRLSTLTHTEKRDAFFQATAKMPLQHHHHHHRGAPAPKRALFATVSAVSLFILALFALAQLSSGPSQKQGRFAARFGSPDHADSPFLSKPRATPAGDKYLLGVGKADITGPVVEINFAGYANTDQVGSGVRQRIYARSFIIGEVGTNNRFVYVILDTQSGDTAVRNGILEGVKALGSGYSMYGQPNVAITGTHSHSGPGGWFNYLLPQVTSLGFDRQGYQAIVDGAVLSIKRAHESLQEVRFQPAHSQPSSSLTDHPRATSTSAPRA